MESMNRNIVDYEKDYSNWVNGFEKYKVIYRRKKVLEIIDSYQPKSILEIGCGMEPLFCYTEGNQKFTIVEPSEKFCENAKRLSMENEKITCINGFFEDIANDMQQVGGMSYDMIICSSLLHEVANPNTLLNAIKKVSMKETIIHINVPNMYSMHRLLGSEMGCLTNVFDMSEENKKLQQNTNFDMHKLKKMVESCGMKVEEEGSYFIKPFSHKQMEAMLEQRIIDEKVLDGLYSITKYLPQFGSEIYVNCKIKE